MFKRYPIVILISGNGSNLQAIMEKCSDLVEVKAVISDQADAFGLTRAQREGIKTEVFEQGPDVSREWYSTYLSNMVSKYKPELVVLAGFMKILSPIFMQRHPNTINIHPSLLPDHKGLHTHKRALEAGDKKHGMSIHWVTSDLDSGPIIEQKAFTIAPGDTAETLEQKVHKLEHRWYPWVIMQFARGNIIHP